VATDETWRWSFEAAGKGMGNRLYLRFWHNALLWLVGELEAQRVSLELADRIVRAGEAVTGTVRVRGRDYAPEAGVPLRVRMGSEDSGSAPVTERELTTGPGGEAELRLTPPGPGVWRIVVGVVGGNAEPVTGAEVYVGVVHGEEVMDIRPNPELMSWIAQESGGRYYNLVRDEPPDRLPMPAERLDRLVSREVTPLWSNWATYALVLGALATEWWTRRRRGFR
jgi:hypothetical protein